MMKQVWADVGRLWIFRAVSGQFQGVLSCLAQQHYGVRYQSHFAVALCSSAAPPSLPLPVPHHALPHPSPTGPDSSHPRTIQPSRGWPSRQQQPRRHRQSRPPMPARPHQVTATPRSTATPAYHSPNRLLTAALRPSPSLLCVTLPSDPPAEQRRTSLYRSHSAKHHITAQHVLRPAQHRRRFVLEALVLAVEVQQGEPRLR